MKKPCRECPFKRTSASGYLGECLYDPELFLQQEEVIPCHLTVDYEGKEPDYSQAQPCVGNLQFMNNSLKLSRNPQVKQLQDEAGKNTKIFQFKSEFINHHSR